MSRVWWRMCVWACVCARACVWGVGGGCVCTWLPLKRCALSLWEAAEVVAECVMLSGLQRSSGKPHAFPKADFRVCESVFWARQGRNACSSHMVSVFSSHLSPWIGLSLNLVSGLASHVIVWCRWLSYWLRFPFAGPVWGLSSRCHTCTGTDVHTDASPCFEAGKSWKPNLVGHFFSYVSSYKNVTTIPSSCQSRAPVEGSGA